MTSGLTDTSRIAATDDCISRVIGGETVLLDLTNGTYFGLDSTGTRIWQLVAEDASLGEIVDVLEREYDAPREQIAADARRFLAELIENGLARTVTSGSGSA